MALREHIIGNEKTLSILIKRSGELKLASLMIFAGPSGIGKKLAALALSQELICPKGPPACGICGACLRIKNQKSESVLMIEPESASAQIKLEQSRQIEQFVQLRQLGRARTIIIDQAHRLNPQASNALLKFFEEPPLNTYIFLISHSPNTLLATIRSRAQLIRFAPLLDGQIKALTGAEDWILKITRGQVDLVYRIKEDSKTWLDSKNQAMGFISNALKADGDFFSKMKEIAGDRETSLRNILVWQSLFRDVLLTQLGAPKVQAQDLINEGAQYLINELAQLDVESISQISADLLGMEQDLNANVDRTLLLESFYFKMTNLKKKSEIRP